MEKIIEKIKYNIVEIQQLPSFTKWFNSQKTTGNDIIIFNNSFVHREESRTNKNLKYLSYSISKSNQIDKIFVYSVNRILNDFKIFSKEKISDDLSNIENVLNDELKNIGELVFILLGTIDEDVNFTNQINTNFLKTITYNPKFSSNLIDGDNLIINDTSDEDEIWELITSYFRTSEFAAELTNDFKSEIGKKLDFIEDISYSKLILKSISDNNSPTILESMLTILKEQLKEYEKSIYEYIESKKDDSKLFNNILRISYNFSTDASTLLKLIMSICDLKPIVLWGTILHHYNLSEAFKDLPWNRSNSKPSLKNYNNIIANSRNQAFHKIFPFKNSLNIELPNNSLKGATIRIFSKHSKKKENQLSYDDKAMVDVLLDFTRTSEHKISFSFWEKNKIIMQLSIKLVEETNDFLKLIYSEKFNLANT
jgi:hypothetical protein